jgi:sulfur transfer complex TusBCD TusB component (DsrH family)
MRKLRNVWKDNGGMGLIEIICEGVDGIYLIQDAVHW